MSWSVGRFTFNKYMITTGSRAFFPYSEACKEYGFCIMFYTPKILDQCLFIHVAEVSEVEALLRIINSPDNIY